MRSRWLAAPASAMLRPMRARLPLIAALVLLSSTAGAQYYSPDPWLGIALESGKKGAAVKQVVPGSPAEDAGLRDGDQVIAVGDTKTRTPDDLQKTIRALQISDRVTLHVVRGDDTIELEATLRGMPDHKTMIRQVLVDRPAPELALDRIKATGTVSSADFEDKVVVLAFFATWCKYCPRVYPKLAALQAKHGDKVVVLGIAGDDLKTLENYLDPDYEPKVTKDKDERIIAREPHYGALGFTALHDPFDKTKSAYWASTLPTMVVIDGEGFVREVQIGADTRTVASVVSRVNDLVDGE
jgi:thiol-disulfide isomerase/thioredoxin